MKSLTKQGNLFLPFGKVRMGYPTGENERGLMFIGGVICHDMARPQTSSPHLTSPEGEGQTPLQVILSLVVV